MDRARRLQIERAANAARRENLADRWQTVLFLMSGVDEQRYPDAGFWKVLALYRRGRISEADATRQRCRLSSADGRALDGERSVATMLAAQHPAPRVQNAAYGFTPPTGAEGVNNDAAYNGPDPSSTL